MRPDARSLLLGLIVLAGIAAAYKVSQRPALALFTMPVVASADAQAMSVSRFVTSQQYIATHAASLVELGDGRVRAFWFAGSREGAEDVEIRTAVLAPDSGRWAAEQSIANRVDTQQSLQRYVKKLGNPVAHRAADGTLRLFYVTVSLGGWAGSSITTITSSDDGASWSTARRLVTSPFLNISTLVKGTPFEYSDGSVGLPVYHEFLGKFGELLRIGRDGEVIDKQRLTSGKTAIQPVMLVTSPQDALVLMRYTGTSAPRRVIATGTHDGGQRWSAPIKSSLANPDAAVTGLVLPDGRMLAVLNDLEKDRDALSLVMSSDNGSNWQTLYQLEDLRGQPVDQVNYARTTARLASETDPAITDASSYARSAQLSKCDASHCGFEFSYPYMIQLRNSDIHLVYTWNRSHIKHFRFNTAWLEQRMKQASNDQHH